MACFPLTCERKNQSLEEAGSPKQGKDKALSADEAAKVPLAAAATDALPAGGTYGTAAK